MELPKKDREELIKYAKALSNFSNTVYQQKRNITAILSGPFPPMEVELLFQRIERQDKTAGQQLKENYKRLIDVSIAFNNKTETCLITDALRYKLKLDIGKVEYEANKLSALMLEIANEQLSTSGSDAGDITQPTPETTKPNAEPGRDLVFICYSHKDERWLNDLQTHLKPYVRNGSVTAWSDKQIAPGSKWLKEIEVALASTKVAILLVTPYFLASDFIHQNELTPLLKEAEKNNVCIIWIPVRACAYKETPLKDYQAVIGPEKPLANMKAERDKAWVIICEEIKKAVSSSLS